MLKNIFKVLNTRPTYQFALRTNQQTILKTFEYEQVSRTSLRQQSESSTPEVLKKEQLQALQLKKDNMVQLAISNDSNPKNHIKVVVKDSSMTQFLQQPYIVPIHSRARKILITGVKRFGNVYQSVKKIYPMMREVIGLHIYAAIERIAQINKKSAKDILSALQMVRSHAVMRGLDEERLYVQGAITNKFKRFTRMRYRGKGSGSQGKRDVSQIRITLEERPAKDMFMAVLKGKTESVLAYQLRNQIVKSQAGLETIQKFQFMLTAKGRQQQKMIMKRQVQLQYKTKKSEGSHLTLKVIEKELIESQAQEMAQMYETRKITQTQSSLKDRQTLFQNNEKLNI